MIKKLLFATLIFMSSHLSAEETVITGNAFYLEHIALPDNAMLIATLEDVSLMDVVSVTLGRIEKPVSNSPVNFSIPYNPDLIQQGRRYNIRVKIIADERLLFISDTAHPVLTGRSQKELNVRMKKI